MAVLEALEAGRDPWVVVRYFEYWMLRVHGLLPDLGSCSACARPLGPSSRPRVDSGGVVRCRGCAARESKPDRMLGPEDLRFLDAAHRLAPTAVEARPRTVRAGSALEALLRGTLESFVERRFRTYRHLRAAMTREEGGTGS